jgi:dTDP-4-amino-4,6-dideoxygalactose transaminase
LSWPNLYSAKVDKLKSLLRRSNSVKKTKSNFVIAKSKPPSTQLIKYLSDKSYIENARTRISHNYQRIIKSALELGFTPQYVDLPNNCVPQWVIIKDKSGHLVKKLREKGIGACNWPGDELVLEVEERIAQYPNSRRLNSELALIPTHQNIREKDCDFIIATLCSLAQNLISEE